MDTTATVAYMQASPFKTVVGGLASLAMEEQRRMCIPLKSASLKRAQAFIDDLTKRINKARKPTAADAHNLAQMIDYDFYTR